MRTTGLTAGLCLAVGLLLVLPASSSSTPCGPGNAGCHTCSGVCKGVGCARPGVHALRPGYCTAAEEAAGAWEVFTQSACAGSLSGACRCYLPTSKFLITQACAP